MLAISLLLVVRENNAEGSQKILLMALYATELCYAVTDITLFCFVLLDISSLVVLAVMMFNVTTVTFFYICIMAMITIDRFLEIYLNIQYQFHWTPKKTKIVLTGTLAICFLSFIPSFIGDVMNSQIVGKILIKLLVPTLIIITFSLFTVGPNITRIFVMRGDISTIGYGIAYMFVPVGFVADAFIYIFNLNVVRKKS